MEKNTFSSLELLEQSKIYVESLKMYVVPLSISIQAITLEKANKYLDGLQSELKEIEEIEKKLREHLH
jgi:hypothetical protein